MSDRAVLDAELADIFRDCLDAPALALRPDTRLRDIAHFDSAKMVMLVLAVEGRFGVRLNSREIDGLQRFGDWLKVLRAHGAGG